ncbi:hypothetical protein ACSSV6_001699 [Roseovarius sp. MBR-38]
MVCRPQSIRYHVRRTLQRVTVTETRMARTSYTEFMTLPEAIAYALSTWSDGDIIDVAIARHSVT